MKKFLSLLLLFALCISLFGCGTQTVSAPREESLTITDYGVSQLPIGSSDGYSYVNKRFNVGMTPFDGWVMESWIQSPPASLEKCTLDTLIAGENAVALASARSDNGEALSLQLQVMTNAVADAIAADESAVLAQVGNQMAEQCRKDGAIDPVCSIFQTHICGEDYNGVRIDATKLGQPYHKVRFLFRSGLSCLTATYDWFSDDPWRDPAKLFYSL